MFPRVKNRASRRFGTAWLAAGIVLSGIALPVLSGAAPATAQDGVGASTVRPASPIVLSTTDQTIEYLTFTSTNVQHISASPAGGGERFRLLPYLSAMVKRSTTMVETHDGSLQVFTHAEGSVWTTKQNGKGGNWSAWSSLGGTALGNGAPAVIRGAGDALWLFAPTSDSGVRTRAQQGPNGPWGPWTTISGPRLYGLSVGRGPGDRLELVGADGQGTLWKSAQSSAGFGAFQQFSDAGYGSTTVDAQVITRADRSLEVVVRTAGGAVSTRRQTAPGGDWGPWTVLAGHTGPSRPAVILGPDGALTVLSADGDGRVFHGLFGVDPTSGTRAAAEEWQDLTTRGAPVAGRRDFSGAGFANGSWIAVYNDYGDAFADIGSGLGDGDTTVRAQPPQRRDLAAVRADDGGDGEHAQEVTPVRGPSATGWTPPAFQYGHFTYDECAKTAVTRQERGTVKNRYSYCWAGTSVVRFKGPCMFGGLLCVGRHFVYTATVIGLGSDYYRQGRYTVYLTEFESLSEYDDAISLTARIHCAPLVAETDCAPDENASEVRRTISGWKSAREAKVTVLGPEPEPDPLVNPDLPGYGSAWIEIVAQLPGGSTRTIESPANRIRFDSAQYLTHNGKSGAIFPDVDPVLNIPINTVEFAAMRQSGLHYKQAMQQPASTVPVVAGKTIPGALGGSPLHRLYFDTDRREENNREAVRTCRSDLVGQYPQPGVDCDEYPFASTYEGASPYYNPQRNFSVKAIPSEDNQAAGTWLSAWYSYDRILDNDAFFVNVVE